MREINADIDECVTGQYCQVENGYCKNTDGSYTCTCVKGYYYSNIVNECFGESITCDVVTETHPPVPRVLPLSMCSVLLSVLFVCTWVGVQVVAFLIFLLYIHIARMLYTCFPMHRDNVPDSLNDSRLLKFLQWTLPTLSDILCFIELNFLKQSRI